MAKKEPSIGFDTVSKRCLQAQVKKVFQSYDDLTSFAKNTPNNCYAAGKAYIGRAIHQLHLKPNPDKPEPNR